MSLKRWVLGKMGGGATRSDGRRVAPSLHGLPERAGRRDSSEPTVGRAAEPRHGRREGIAHLGPYAPLVAAIRDELEHFVASQLRLHLAIAERDRYVLTSIGIECRGGDEHKDLLRRFVAEFRPEQIKHYLAREVIAGLSNASSIDLSQFAGLNAPAADAPADAEDPYQVLLDDLRSSAPGTSVQPFVVTLDGRWTQADAPTARRADAVQEGREPSTRMAEPVKTPLADRSFALDLEDAAGTRRVELAAIVPGRRYVIGKDGGCDIVVDGTYASRRHCEIWFDRGVWWVADAGSTNGLRVEAGGGVARTGPSTTSDAISLELPESGSLVLSAHAQGKPRDYPRLTVRSLPAGAGERSTAITAGLVTPIAPPRVRRATLTVAAHMACGVREAEILEGALPFRVGRSRNQALVIDWTHAEVSARHIEIVAIDERGASVVVHGDNGVTVDGKPFAAGAQFSWRPGETMLLGRRDASSPACSLTLAHTP